MSQVGRTGVNRYIAPGGFVLATSEPRATDDKTAGFAPGAFWFNFTLSHFYVCVDAALGAAQWAPVHQATRSNASTSNPTVNDDTTLGYHIGDLWVNTGDNGSFICVDNAEGAADWNEFTTIP